MREPCGQPLSHAWTMTSGTPTSKSEQQTPAVAAPVAPKPEKPWWRRWMEPILAVTIIAALLTALVTGGAVAFQRSQAEPAD